MTVCERLSRCVLPQRIDSNILPLSYAVFFVKFTETYLTATEPGTVEVMVELIGIVKFDVNVTIEVDFENSTATGESKYTAVSEST